MTVASFCAGGNEFLLSYLSYNFFSSSTSFLKWIKAIRDTLIFCWSKDLLSIGDFILKVCSPFNSHKLAKSLQSRSYISYKNNQHYKKMCVPTDMAQKTPKSLELAKIIHTGWSHALSMLLVQQPNLMVMLPLILLLLPCQVSPGPHPSRWYHLQNKRSQHWLPQCDYTWHQGSLSFPPVLHC